MKKITTQRAHDILATMANGGNPDCTTEELMLSTAMGATALRCLSDVAKLAIDTSACASAACMEIMEIQGKDDEPAIILPNGSARPT